MGSPLVLDELVVLLAAFILVAELWSLGMVRRLRREVNGGEGAYLLTLVFRFGVVITFGQAFVLAIALLRLCDPAGTGDARLWLFFFVQLLFAVAFTWTVWEVHGLSKTE